MVTSEILFHFSNDMTMTMTVRWTFYAYAKTGLLLRFLKRNQTDTFFLKN